jgi:hypothetical protein
MLAIGPVGSAARVRRASAAAPVVSVAAKRRREIVWGFMVVERGEGAESVMFEAPPASDCTHG